MAIALTAVLWPIAAQASLPIFGGLSYNASSNSGYLDPRAVSQPQRGVTNAGYAVGSVYVGGPTGINVGARVQFWTPTSVGTLPGITLNGESSSEMYAVATNSSNTVIGDFEPLHPENPSAWGGRAFRYSAGVMQKLGDLSVSPSGLAFTYVSAINTAGISVGA